MHYLNHTLTMFASHGDKTWAQLTGSIFSRKRYFDWLNLKNVMLIHFLPVINPNFFINQNCILSQNWELPFYKKCANDKLPSSFTILFHLSLKIIKHHLPLKNSIPYGKNAFTNMTLRTWNDVHKEMKGMMLNKFLLVILKPLLIELYLNMCNKSFVIPILLKIVLC